MHTCVILYSWDVWTCHPFRIARSMEYKPNSPLHQATVIWDGPHCLGFNTKASRLKSYVHWPRGMNPSPESLSTAGFYFTGKCYLSMYHNTLLQSLSPNMQHTKKNFIYRYWWLHKMFPLRRKTEKLASHGWRVVGTRVLVSVLRLRPLHQGRRIHTQRSKVLSVYSQCTNLSS